MATMWISVLSHAHILPSFRSAQLEAVKENEKPRADHGVAVMYEFATDAGSMERSRYFGFSKV